MSRRFAVRLAGIVLAGVALRTVYLLTVGRDVTGIGDWWFYHWTANDLADGHFYVEPFRMRFEDKVLPSAGHPPLYPLLLSPISWLGGTGVMWHRAAGLLFGGLTIALMGVLGRRVGGERLGLAAAAVCAVYPLMIVVDGALMSETAYTPVVVLVLLVAWSALEKPRLGVFAGLGALIGIAALVRSEALLLLPLLAWPVAVRGGAGWLPRALVASVACAAALAPWTIRNAVEFGHLIPISINDSTVLRGANCDATYAGQDIGFWRLDCIPSRRFDNEGEQAASWRADGLRVRARARRAARRRRARADPAHLLALPAAPPGGVRRGALGPRRAGRRGRLLSARAARPSRARSRCGAAACRCWCCSRPGRSCCCRSRSGTAIRGCGTCSSPR